MTTHAASLVLAAAMTLAAPLPLDPVPLPEEEEMFAVRTEAPDTDSCPHAVLPPEAHTTSELLPPGHPGIDPLPPSSSDFCGVSAVIGYHVPEDVLASAFLVADVDTGDIIAQKDPHGRYRPASIIKGLLAMVAVRDLPADQVVTASYESASQHGSAVGLGEGGEYTVEELVHGLMMGSGNDAAHALAQALGGDTVTLEKVNALATELGTTDTRVSSYSGLDAPGMSTSAYDMGLVYRAIYHDPILADIVATDTYPFPGYADVEGYELWNDNGLLMNDEHGIGGKTGYTDDANHTFVGAMDRDGRRLMAVILDTTNDSGAAWQQAQSLLHAAYDIPQPVVAASAVGSLEPVTDAEAEVVTTTEPAPVEGAVASPPQTAEATPEHRIYSLVAPIAIVAIVVISVVAALTSRRRPRS